MKNIAAILHVEYQRQKSIHGDWGRYDCLTFAADCAMAITGRDPAADLRGTYSSELGAKRVMIERGWNSLADVAASMYEKIPVAFANTGDWVELLNENGVETIGVVMGSVIVARAESGLGIVPLTKARNAYRVT